MTVVFAVTGYDETNCAKTLHWFNKHASSRRQAVTDFRMCTDFSGGWEARRTLLAHSHRAFQVLKTTYSADEQRSYVRSIRTVQVLEFSQQRCWSTGVCKFSVMTCCFRNPVETLTIKQGGIYIFLQEVSSRLRVCLFFPRDRPLKSKILAANTRWTREIFSYYPSLLLEPASGLCVKFCFSARTVCAAVGQFRAPTHALLFE